MTISQGYYAIGSNAKFQNLGLETSLKFKGTGTVLYNHIEPYNLSTDFTLQSKVYFNTIPSPGDKFVIFTKNLSTPEDNSLYITSLGVEYNVNGTTHFQAYTFIPQQYYTISIVIDNTNSEVRIYVNGLKLGTQAIVSGWFVTTNPLLLSSPTDNTIYKPIDGKMLFFRTTKEVFSDNDVAFSYNNKSHDAVYILNSFTISLTNSVILDHSVFGIAGIRSDITNLVIEWDLYDGRYGSFIDAQLDIIDQTGNLTLDAIEDIAHPDESIFTQNRNGFQFTILNTVIPATVVEPIVEILDKTQIEILREILRCRFGIPELCDTIIEDCAILASWKSAVKWWVLYRHGQQAGQVFEVDSSGMYTFIDPPPIPDKILFVQEFVTLSKVFNWSYAPPIIVIPEGKYFICYEQNMCDITQLDIIKIHEKLLQLFFYNAKIKIGQFLKFSDFADSPFDVDGSEIYSTGITQELDLKEHIMINRDEGP